MEELYYLSTCKIQVRGSLCLMKPEIDKKATRGDRQRKCPELSHFF